MPRREGQGRGNDPLETGKIYHLYNRTLDGMIPFSNGDFCIHFLQLLNHCKTFTTSYSQHKQKVSLYGEDDFRMVDSKRNPRGLKRSIPVRLHAYVIMSNHFHLLVEQLAEEGISYFAGRVLNSFTKIFNQEKGRSGPLWQGPFRAKLIDSNESFLQLIRYIHLNPIHSALLKIKKLERYEFSSYLDAIGKRSGRLCDHSLLRSLIVSPQEYKEFVHAGITEDEGRLLERLVIEEPFAD